MTSGALIYNILCFFVYHIVGIVCAFLSGSTMPILSPGSPSFRAIIPHMTFDPHKRKAEGEPGISWHMTDVKLHQGGHCFT